MGYKWLGVVFLMRVFHILPLFGFSCFIFYLLVYSCSFLTLLVSYLTEKLIDRCFFSLFMPFFFWALLFWSFIGSSWFSYYQKSTHKKTIKLYIISRIFFIKTLIISKACVMLIYSKYFDRNLVLHAVRKETRF